MYASEQDLVDEFVSCLGISGAPWIVRGILFEFWCQRGRTDIVVVSLEGNVIAFEAKLIRWRDAMHQAYRNTSFAHYSYILLPKDKALLAERHSPEFEDRKVGICYIQNGTIKIALEAPHQEPIQQWLSEKAIHSSTLMENNA